MILLTEKRKNFWLKTIPSLFKFKKDEEELKRFCQNEYKKDWRFAFFNMQKQKSLKV